MKLICKLFFLVSLLFLGVGCGGGSGKVRIGAKNFAEQEILAQMAKQLLNDRGIPTEPIDHAKDTATVYSKLRHDELDVIIDYTGTALNLFGIESVSEEEDRKVLQKKYAELGLEWLEPLEFQNGYCLYVTDRAKLKTMGDLKKLGHVRLACPRAYLRRSRDGIESLRRFYAFKLARKPLVIDDVSKRYEALFDNRVDVILGFETDGPATNPALVKLEDRTDKDGNVKFFLPYETAFVMRKKAPHAKEVKALLNELTEKFIEVANRESKQTKVSKPAQELMRKLNFEVEVDKRKPAQVARDFLQKHKLLKNKSKLGRKVELKVVIHEDDDLGDLQKQAERMLKRAFPKRTVKFIKDDNPAELISNGKAKLALIGAERFFRTNSRGTLVREKFLEAAAVVNTRYLHVIEKSDSPTNPFAKDAKIGVVGSRESSVVHLAEELFRRKASELLLTKSVKELLESVRDGKSNVGLILAPIPEAKNGVGNKNGKQTALVKNLESFPGLILKPLQGMPADRVVVMPYLRPNTIPAETYPRQLTPVETRSSQVVLAGAPHKDLGLSSGVGPASAIPMGGIPLTKKEVEDLTAAGDYQEAPDSSLPSVWQDVTVISERGSIFTSIWKTALNIFIIAFLSWLVWLVLTGGSRPKAAKTVE